MTPDDKMKEIAYRACTCGNPEDRRHQIWCAAVERLAILREFFKWWEKQRRKGVGA